jgi:hypothetical protein
MSFTFCESGLASMLLFPNARGPEFHRHIYEQVTNILGMRELEDEGKIMAMADYSYPLSSGITS